MKKITLLLTLLFLIGFSWLGSAQIYVSEDFEAGTTLPAGWTDNDISGSGFAWEFTNPGGRTINSPVAGNFAIFDSDNNGGGTENSALESPVFNASAATVVKLSFDHYFRTGFGGAYDVEVYNGSTWVSVLSGSASSTANAASENIDISAQVAGVSNAQVRFRWTGNYSWYWAVDNIIVQQPTVSAPNCATTPTPADGATNVALSTGNGGDVTISWSAPATGDAPDSYKVFWGTTSGSLTNIGSTTATTVNITNLSNSTQYFWQIVPTNVGGDATGCPEWSFTTAAPTAYCTPAPSSVDSNGITGIAFSNIDNQVVEENGVYYHDYSAMLGDVIAGTTENIDITYETGYSYNTFVWIDWNDDFDFDDADEAQYLGNSSSTNPETLTWTFTVPATASAGNHRMRIGAADSGLGSTTPSNPCYTGSYGEFEDYTVSVSIPSCFAPSAMVASNITATTADLDWTAGGAETVWDLEISEAGFTATGTPTNNDVTKPFSFTGATANTTYDVYYRADCGANNTDVSTWVGPFSFTTLCSTFDAPYTEDFEDGGALDTCWSQSATDNLDWTVNSGGTISSGTGPSAANGGTYYVYVESSGSSNSDTAELLSPNINLNTLTTPRLNFYYHMYGAGMDPDGSLDVAISTDGGGSYTSIFNQVGDQGNQWNNAIVDLSAYSGVVSFKITGTISSTGTTYENDFAIDDFVVEETPSCLAPSAMAASNITTTTADLDWTIGGSETVWDLEIGAAGFAATGTPTNNDVTKPFTFTGGTSATTYDVYYRADCGADNTNVSTWVGPFSFTTTPDYCAGDHFYDTGGAAGNYGNSENTTTVIYPVTAGDVVTVTFNSFNIENGWDGLMIYDGPDTSAPLIDSGSTYGRTTCPNGAWTGNTTYVPTTFTSTHASGSLTFVFTSDGGVQSDGWDATITCAAPPSCIAPTAMAASNITATTADLDWTVGGSETVWDLEIGVAGFAATGTPTDNDVTKPFSFTGGASATTYDVYYRADCGANNTNVSTWVGPFSFTTTPDYCAGDHFYDTGGAAGNYGNNENITTVIYPVTAGDVVTVTFNSFDTEAGYDDLTIYDGDTSGAPVLGTFDGTTLPGPFTSTHATGALTFVFSSDGSANKAGWDATITCGPPPACPVPSAMTASNITETTADLNWTAGGSETVWDLEIGVAGFAATGTPTDNDVTKPFSFTGGASATTYDVYYRADCGANNTNVSTWVGPFSFTTDQPGNTCDNPIAIGSLPYSTSDDTANYYDDYSGSPGATGCGTTSSYLNGDDVVYAYTATSDTTLNFALSNIGSTYSGMFVYTNCADIGTACAIGQGNSSSTADYNFDLNVTNGTTYYIVISTWASPQSTTYTLDITEITCPPPTAMAASNITATTADLDWTVGGSETVWDLEIGVAGFAATGTPTDNDVTKPFTFTGGTPSTTYDVYYRADCGADNTDVSTWVGPVTFTTYSSELLDWNNLQYPSSITMTYGNTTDDNGNPLDVYAQAYEPGVTNNGANPPDAGSGIQAWIGYGPTGSTPDDTWTWIAATYNTDSGNNDEYTINFGGTNTPLPGTYDYASRFQLGAGVYSYGGTSGIWNNDSGTITVNPISGDLCTNAISLTLGTVFDDNDIVGTNVNTTPSGESPDPTCSNFGSGEDTWFSIIVPASGNITIETKTDDDSITDTGMSVYSGSCGSLSEVQCDDDSGDVYFSLVDLTGQTPGDTLYIRVFEFGNNATGTFLISAYTKCSGATITWDPTTGDWVGGTPPNATNPIIFPTGTNNGTGTDLGNITACSCQLDGNAIIEVDTNEHFKIMNDVILNDTSEMYVYDKASFVQVSDNASVTVASGATMVVETNTRSLADTGRYTYVSSPTQGDTLSEFDWAMQNRMWEFDTAVQDWALAPATSVMVSGKGYIVRPDPTQNFPYVGNTLFVGAFNNGVITRTLAYNSGGSDDDNTLVGNPYPSPIDTEMLLTNNPRANAFYFWTHENSANSDDNFTSNDDYAVWNATGGTSGNATEAAPAYIAPGQGFFVVAAPGASPAEITFNNALRTVNNNNGLLRPSSNLDKLWVNLTNANNINSQILVGFNPICTDGFDVQYDAARFNSGTAVSLASQGIGVDTDHLAIQTRGLLDQNSDTSIPLRIEVSDANITNFTLSIDHFENLTDVNVYLRDNQLNILHNLKVSDYNFVLNSTGMNDTRFELVFSRGTLSTQDNVLTNDNLIIANQDATSFTVKMANGSIIKNFKAFDVVGKLIIDTKPNSNNFTINKDLKQGTVLFVKATLENGQVLSKKFIKL